MHAVKFADGSDVEIVGLGMPYGGPFGGRDLDHQFFSVKTEFNFDWFAERPLLYQHGLEDIGTTVVGRVKAWESRDDGVWVRAQIDKQNRYFAAIKELIDRGVLYFSSGAMAHLVKVNEKSGEIVRWPWVELSLTPTPANLLATVDVPTAEKHCKAAGLELPAVACYAADSSQPPPVGIIPSTTSTTSAATTKATLDAEARNELDDSDFAYIDSEGGRHLPIHDAAHCRAALARFNQTRFESEAARERAWRKLVARCREFDIEVAAEMPAKAVAYEMLVAELQAQVNAHNPFGETVHAIVEATLPGEVYVSRKCIDDVTFWRIPYALTADGSPRLGAPVEITEADMPVMGHSVLPETSFTIQADTVAHYAQSLTERTKDLVERRIKEGRVLSVASRARLVECVQRMREAADSLQEFLDATDPARAKAKADLEAILSDLTVFELSTAL